ncbi:MAG: acyltransferase [Actinobacteria bacterium]|nr:acyltransferase [Actinomycetota bacterium]
MAATGPVASLDHGTGENRFPCFDGLRALAAFAVLTTHLAYAGGANSENLFGPFWARMDGGVTVFFVLSGFLIYRPFARARILGRPVPAAAPYFWRRFLRIYPAYWLVLAVVVFGFGDKAFGDLKSFVLDVTLLHPYSVTHAIGPLPQSWTLSTEVAFYVFVPIWVALVGLVARNADRVRRELVGVGLLVIMSVAYKAIVLSLGLPGGRVGQLKLLLPWWLDVFAIGMLLAVLSIGVRDLGRPTPLRLDTRAAPLVCWLLALGAVVWVSLGAGLPYETPEIARHLLWGQHYLYALVALFLVLPAVFGPQVRTSSPVRRFLMSGVIVYLGTISYGIYLWQEPLIDRYLSWTGLQAFTVYTSDVPFRWHTNELVSVPWFAFVAAVTLLTIFAATISWYALERPVLRLKHLVGRSLPTPRPATRDAGT